jgi:hypothetical protein
MCSLSIIQEVNNDCEKFNCGLSYKFTSPEHRRQLKTCVGSESLTPGSAAARLHDRWY